MQHIFICTIVRKMNDLQKSKKKYNLKIVVFAGNKS